MNCQCDSHIYASINQDDSESQYIEGFCQHVQIYIFQYNFVKVRVANSLDSDIHICNIIKRKCAQNLNSDQYLINCTILNLNTSRASGGWLIEKLHIFP